MFRSAIGGFNKNDVLTYIDGITGEWDGERQSLQAQAEQATAAQQEAERTAAQATARAEQLQAENAGIRQELLQEREKTAAADKELTALRERLDRCERELAQRADDHAKIAALLGDCDTVPQRMEQIVRPFMDDAAGKANGALEEAERTAADMKKRLEEMQSALTQQRQTLAKDKQTADDRLSETLGDWLTKARTLAQDAASRTAHFFR